MEKLITDYRYELSEPACSPGSGRYGVQVTPAGDISAAFPYLNAVLQDTWYDHEDQVLVGGEDGQRYAFRPDEIRVAGIRDASEAGDVATHIVERINEIWGRRQEITPSYRERKVPAVAELYQCLPKTNCKQCGYPTCLAFAAELRNDPELLVRCQPLAAPGHAADVAHMEKLFAGE